MNNLFDKVNLILGTHVSESSSPLLLFACSILLLSIVALLSFIYILIYLGVLYIVNTKTVLDKLSKYAFLLKIINVFNKTRLIYIFIDVIFFIYSLGSIIGVCCRII